MPKAQLIVPWSDAEGKPHAAGEEVDLSDEEYQDLRADGKVTNIEEPYAGEPGHYGDRTERPHGAEDETVPTGREEHPHGGPPGQTGEHPQGGPPGQQPRPEPREAPKKK
jgi:hypothetical protein